MFSGRLCGTANFQSEVRPKEAGPAAEDHAALEGKPARCNPVGEEKHTKRRGRAPEDNAQTPHLKLAPGTLAHAVPAPPVGNKEAGPAAEDHAALEGKPARCNPVGEEKPARRRGRAPEDNAQTPHLKLAPGTPAHAAPAPLSGNAGG